MSVQTLPPVESVSTYRPANPKYVLLWLTSIIIAVTVIGLALAGIDAKRHPWNPTVVDIQGCNTEDGSNAPCYWDATVEGNGKGTSILYLESDSPVYGWECRSHISSESFSLVYECKERN